MTRNELFSVVFLHGSEAISFSFPQQEVTNFWGVTELVIGKVFDITY